MRKHILRDIHGGRIEEPAKNLSQAIQQVSNRGIKLRRINPVLTPRCSGDCGDCNDVRECAAKEQAL